MSERTRHHLIAQHLSDFLQHWYGQAANARKQPPEEDFAAWLGDHAYQHPARTPA